ncbi:MAG: hypothetical protein R2797_05625 [Gelidibacter sp.]
MTVPVVESITAESVGIGLKAKVPPANPEISAVAPSQVAVMVKLPSSIGITSKLCAVVEEQALVVEYSTVYVNPIEPPVTVPVTESIVAMPSVVTSENVPPPIPVIFAVAPSQVGVSVKLESSKPDVVKS